MRLVGWSLVILAAAVWLASNWPATDVAEADSSAVPQWRRTAQGWERLRVGDSASTSPATLHPLVVGALEILLSLTTLVAFTPYGPSPSVAWSQPKESAPPVPENRF